MKTIKTSILAFVLLFSSCKEESKPIANTADRPNIIIILADDLGYGDPEVYNSESKIPTPNINNLAANGMRFTDAHSPSSVCTPTRYGILTGSYAWRTPLKKSVLWAWDKPLIQPNETTMPKMLKKQGYNTACIGKWHLGWRWQDVAGNYVNDTIAIGDYNLKGRNELWKQIDFSKPIGGGPLGAGFDYYFGDDVPNFAPYAFFKNDRLVTVPNQQKPADMFGGSGPMVAGWNLTQVMPTITQKSVTYIEEQAKSENPFFLYFALTAPHTPIAPTKEFIGTSKAGLYGDFVNEVDHTVGQIIAALERTGQLENTIVVFTSDNGSPQRDGENMSGKTGSVKKYNHDPSRPLRGIKSDIWDGGHRVPFIVSWPKKIKKGMVNTTLVCLTDLMRTFQSVTGLEGEKLGADSFDISELLLDKPNATVRDFIVHHSINGIYSIRKGPWKLILGTDSGGWSPPENLAGEVIQTTAQLYNMDDDIAEQHNLYTEYPELVSELKMQLKKYQEQGYSNPDYNTAKK